jgi:hypothetical protein
LKQKPWSLFSQQFRIPLERSIVMGKRTETAKRGGPRLDVRISTVAEVAPVRPAKTVNDEDIRLRAYQEWEAAGKPSGDGVRFWLEAERQLQAGT